MAQLDDLAAAKAAHEQALLAKFAALVNAKKLKIRDLQRVLATATVDERRAEEVGAARGGAGAKTRRKGAGARRGKRKASEAEQEDESSDGFEGRGPDEPGDEDGRELVTPEPSGDETESDGEDEEQPQTKSGRGAGAEGKAAETQSMDPGAKNQKNDTPPPKRELPFLRQPPRGPKGWDPMEVDPPEPASAAQDDDETDEL